MEKLSTIEKPSANEETDALEDYSITTLQLGIWRMFVPVEPSKLGLPRGFSFWWKRWNTAKATFPLIWSFILEVYNLDPGLNLLVFALRLASSIEGTLMLYASSQLLRTVMLPHFFIIFRSQDARLKGGWRTAAQM